MKHFFGILLTVSLIPGLTFARSFTPTHPLNINTTLPFNRVLENIRTNPTSEPVVLPPFEFAELDAVSKNTNDEDPEELLDRARAAQTPQAYQDAHFAYCAASKRHLAEEINTYMPGLRLDFTRLARELHIAQRDATRAAVSMSMLNAFPGRDLLALINQKRENANSWGITERDFLQFRHAVIDLVETEYTGNIRIEHTDPRYFVDYQNIVRNTKIINTNTPKEVIYDAILSAYTITDDDLALRKFLDARFDKELLPSLLLSSVLYKHWAPIMYRLELEYTNLYSQFDIASWLQVRAALQSVDLTEHIRDFHVQCPGWSDDFRIFSRDYFWFQTLDSAQVYIEKAYGQTISGFETVAQIKQYVETQDGVPFILQQTNPHTYVPSGIEVILLSEADSPAFDETRPNVIAYYTPGESTISLSRPAFERGYLTPGAMVHELAHAIDDSTGFTYSKQAPFASAGIWMERVFGPLSFSSSGAPQLQKGNIYVPYSLRNFISSYSAYGGPKEDFAEMTDSYFTHPFTRCIAPLKYARVKEVVYRGIEFFNAIDCDSFGAQLYKQLIRDSLGDLYLIADVSDGNKLFPLDSFNVPLMDDIVSQQESGGYSVTNLKVGGVSYTGVFTLDTQFNPVTSSDIPISDARWAVVGNRFVMKFQLESKWFTIVAIINATNYLLWKDITITGKIYDDTENEVGTFEMTD